MFSLHNTINLEVLHKWRHAIMDNFWDPFPFVLLLVLSILSQNHRPNTTLQTGPWRHLWTTPEVIMNSPGIQILLLSYSFPWSTEVRLAESSFLLRSTRRGWASSCPGSLGCKWLRCFEGTLWLGTLARGWWGTCWWVRTTGFPVCRDVGQPRHRRQLCLPAEVKLVSFIIHLGNVTSSS